MGLFGSIFKPITHAVTSVVKTITSPAKLTTAIVTGGASVVAPKVFAPLTSAVQSTLYNPSLATKAIGLAAGGGLPSVALPKIGASTMGLNLGGLLGGAVSGLTSLFSGASPSTALQSFSTGLAYGSGQPFGAATTTPGYGAYPVQNPAGNAMRVYGGAIASVARKFRDKFPNLWSRLQVYKLSGIKMTRARLWAMVKRFGPDFLITAGILTAVEINELMLAGPGRRRMNPGNVKALRRSMRRLESFHHLCTRADKLRRRRKSGPSTGSRTSQQITRLG